MYSKLSFFVDFINCFTHGRMKYSCLKVVDPEGKKKAKKADFLNEVSDLCQFVTDENYRNYFTSVHIPLENAREKYEKQKHDRVLEYFEVRNRKNPGPKPYYDEVTFSYFIHYRNKTKDWALVQNVALAIYTKVLKFLT